MKQGIKWIVPALAVALAVVGIFALRGLTADTPTVPAARTIPAFQGTDLNGKALSLADYKGKVVLLDFWATWCPPCRAEVPNVVKTYKANRSRGFEVVGISLDKDKAALKSYIKANGMSWRQVFDGDKNFAIANRFKVQAIPTTYLVDGSTGAILAEDVRGAELAKSVDSALKARGK